MNIFGVCFVRYEERDIFGLIMLISVEDKVGISWNCMIGVLLISV